MAKVIYEGRSFTIMQYSVRDHIKRWLRILGQGLLVLGFISGMVYSCVTSGTNHTYDDLTDEEIRELDKARHMERLR